LERVNIPSNVTFIDVSNLEKSLYRASMASNQQLPPHEINNSPSLSLKGMINQLGIPSPPHIPISNSGNAAFYMMLVFQMLVDRDCQIPPVLQMPTQPHVPYPTMQIYPAVTTPPLMPAVQPSFSRSNSPRRSKMATLPMEELVQQRTGGRPISQLPPTRQRETTGTMKRAKTMYWDEAALLNMAGPPKSHVQEVSSGSGSGGTGKDRGRETKTSQPSANNPKQQDTDGLKKSMSKMTLAAEKRSGSDEVVPKSGSRFFLGSIGRKSSGK
jgi:hypothetical protein